jgi:hypothetical protein
VAVLGIAAYYVLRARVGSCDNPVADSAQTRTEIKAFFNDAESLYGEQRDMGPKPRPTMPLRAGISDGVATLWVSGPMYAGDFEYAQLWQQAYQHDHPDAHCARLRLVWKNGGILQRFPPDTL